MSKYISVKAYQHCSVSSPMSAMRNLFSVMTLALLASSLTPVG